MIRAAVSRCWQRLFYAPGWTQADWVINTVAVLIATVVGLVSLLVRS